MTTRNLFDRPELLDNQTRLIISADSKPRRLPRSPVRSAAHHERLERSASINSASSTREVDEDLLDETEELNPEENDLLAKVKEINYDTDIEEEKVADRNYSCRSVYFNQCRRQGVIPATYFLRHLDKEALVIRYCGLKPINVRVMVPALKVNSTITKLDLRENDLGSQGAIYIGNLLKENDYIDELNLGNNDIGTRGKLFDISSSLILNSFIIGCKALCEALIVNHTIRTLYLDGNRFNDACASLFAEVFAQNERINYINLNKNFFENENTGRLFGQSLKENSSLEELHLAFNRLNSKACGYILKSLATNERLITLDLSWNGAGLFAAKAIFELLKTNKILENLHLSNNRFNTECATYIGKGLGKNVTLKNLTLNGNPLESSGCYAVLRPLVKNPASVLRSVDFRRIIINRDFIDLLNELSGILPDLMVKNGSEGEVEVV